MIRMRVILKLSRTVNSSILLPPSVCQGFLPSYAEAIGPTAGMWLPVTKG